MKDYIQPEIKLIEFNCKDIITTSGGDIYEGGSEIEIWLNMKSVALLLQCDAFLLNVK